ncbi:hypothetical protein RJT34_16844 [Clitoria ternatea]|uniref:Uncharacterized protein n=1 Tax=Clitoria ternatea TaxID=43366 RepID=A0AAN9PD73_CLITE
MYLFNDSECFNSQQKSVHFRIQMCMCSKLLAFTCHNIQHMLPMPMAVSIMVGHMNIYLSSKACGPCCLNKAFSFLLLKYFPESIIAKKLF